MKKQKIIARLIPSSIFVFLFFACNSNSEKKEPDAIQPATHELKSVFVNGDSLHYVEIGKGEPVIFIHGTLNDYRAWEMQMDTFSKHYRVISYSRRYAYPNSQVVNDTADYSVTIHAKDLAEFIKSLNLGPVHLVGHSYGAYTALLTTMDHPELVKTLTLGEPPVMPLLQSASGGDNIVNDFMNRSIIPAAKEFKSGNNEKGISMFIGGITGDTGFYFKLPPEVQSMMMANIPELRGVALSKNSFPSVTCRDLNKINTPVLLLTGEKTALLFSAITDELNKCLPDKEKAVLPAATHGLQFENPGDFNKIVLGFIDKH
ncbi:MAG TPA: alpha/beta hydrolase [Chitinophagaceae bacterium]|nr:alpha/beta hydrolase [Chitinophagaceae bacterium]